MRCGPVGPDRGVRWGRGQDGGAARDVVGQGYRAVPDGRTADGHPRPASPLGLGTGGGPGDSGPVACGDGLHGPVDAGHVRGAGGPALVCLVERERLVLGQRIGNHRERRVQGDGFFPATAGRGGAGPVQLPLPRRESARPGGPGRGFPAVRAARPCHMRGVRARYRVGRRQPMNFLNSSGSSKFCGAWGRPGAPPCSRRAASSCSCCLRFIGLPERCLPFAALTFFF